MGSSPTVSTEVNWLKEFLFPKVCIFCGKLGWWLCGECKSGLEPKRERKADSFSLFDYRQKEVREVIKTIKYRLCRELVVDLLEGEDLGIKGLKIDVIVPVPLHRRRENWRGFNQAEEIARFLVSAINKPMGLWLKREKFTQPLAEMKEDEKRWKEVQGVFDLIDGVEARDKRILLVDDVMTSGATLEEAAGVLRQSGAKKVWKWVLAS